MEVEGRSGAGVSAGHDQMEVIGSSTLAGTLSVVNGISYVDPTSLAKRDDFTLITSAGGSTATFGTVNYNDAGLPADFTGANGSSRSHQGSRLFRNNNYDVNNVILTKIFPSKVTPMVTSILPISTFSHRIWMIPELMRKPTIGRQHTLSTRTSFLTREFRRHRLRLKCNGPGSSINYLAPDADWVGHLRLRSLTP